MKYSASFWAKHIIIHEYINILLQLLRGTNGGKRVINLATSLYEIESIIFIDDKIENIILIQFI